MTHPEIIVVGAGNAAFCAALAAREAGASVLMLERAPEAENGGNSRFTAGAFRFAYAGADDIRALCPDLPEAQAAISDFGDYPEECFYDDMFRLTRYRTDPALCERLVTESAETMRWLRAKGIRFMPIYGRQAFEIDGRFRFWGGLTLEAWGGGPGLVDGHTGIARSAGIDIRYGARVLDLIHDGHTVGGVRFKQDGRIETVPAKAVVLAAGGFQANPEWRTRYLGPGWELAKVRGSRFNTGDGIRMALEAGARPHGNWSGCHSVGWDISAPPYGDRAVGDNFQKHSYPLGIMVNLNGERFVDEGEDYRNLTYVRFGRAIMGQPHRWCAQIFDAKTVHMLRDEYRIREVTKVEADSIEELAAGLEIDPAALGRTISDYNAACRSSNAYNPAVLDGVSTEGLSPDKTNWALPIDSPPYVAFVTTTGITFTFGGLQIDDRNRVQDLSGRPMDGLYAAGELVGGLFFENYPGGSGLMSGSVFGRRAGRFAAEYACG